MKNNSITWIKGILVIVGSMITTILGGWDMLLKTLVGFVVVDYILGVTAAGVNKEINSNVGFKGIFKKIILFIPVGLAHSLDQVLGTKVLRNVAVWFYIANEGISIIENLGKAGTPIPIFLKDILVQLRNSSDKGEDING